MQISDKKDKLSNNIKLPDDWKRITVKTRVADDAVLVIAGYFSVSMFSGNVTGKIAKTKHVG